MRGRNYNAYHELRAVTERSVGKYDMERILGRHVLACIDYVANRDRNGFVAGFDMRDLQEQWANGILRSIGSAAGAEDDGGGGVFQTAVRKIVKRFFGICNAILKREPEPYSLQDQLVFYTSLSTQDRRTVVQLERMINQYVNALRNLVAVAGKASVEDFQMHAVSAMVVANQLGYVLDLEFSK